MARRNSKGQFQGFGKKHGKKGRRFGALPTLADLKGSTSGTDVLMGVAVGLLGAAGARWAMNWLNSSGTLTIDTSGLVYNGSPLIGGIVAGAIAHNMKKPAGWLIGAVASGLAVVGYEQALPRVAPSLFGFGRMVQENTRGYGALQQESLRQFGSQAAKDELAQVALQDGMGSDDADAIESLLN